MSDSLLSYFEQELRFIRQEVTQFVARHSQTATAMGISNEGIDDPEIARLIESFALLNGRLQKRLDASYPELTESLIRLLFPHYLRPIPSFSMLEMLCDKKSTATHHIPAGVGFDIIDKNNEGSVFTTTKKVDLYPIGLSSVNVEFAPFDRAKPPGADRANALIEITFAAMDAACSIADLEIEQLTLHLKGDAHFILPLHDLLLQETLQICVSSADLSYPIGKNAMSVIGFDFEDHILPYEAACFDGFKLLTEFFMFPESFQGFKFDLKQALSQVAGAEFKLQLFLNKLPVDLARNLSLQNFALFCTPLINLYQTATDPMKIDFLRPHYPVVLDGVQNEDIEVFSIDQVFDITSDEPIEVPQIYGEKHAFIETGLRWQLLQKQNEKGHYDSEIKVADLLNVNTTEESRVWMINATVTNSGKVAQLLNSSQILCRESITLPASLHLLRRPTLPIRSKDTEQNAWILLCHLHFNYQSVLGSDDPVSALKNIFHLYNYNQGMQNNAYIESMIAIEQEQVVAPIRILGKSSFAYGTRITLTLDIREISGGVVLFCHLLNRFFANFSGFNSFIQLNIKLDGQDGYYIEFPRESGCKNLL